MAPTVEVKFKVPLTAPSVNHYSKHTRTGRHYVTGEAKAFKQAIAIFARGQQVRADEYRLCADIYLGKGQRQDLDNGAKCICDGLVDAGVIH